jgi:hypothetical protein
MSSYEAKRLLNLSEAPIAYEHESIRSESRFEVSENTWKSSNPHEPSSGALTRANSDISLYMPVRRRSVIQTPGVATRAPRPTPAVVVKKPSFRHSHPPTPGRSRTNSFSSESDRVLSMPPRFLERESVERVVTPCESEYKQLGMMKFGSLRITNGAASPVPPSPESHRSHRSDIGSRHSDASTKETHLSANLSVTSIGPKSIEGKRKNGELTAPLAEPKPLLKRLSPLVTSFLRSESSSNRHNSAKKGSPKQQALAVKPEYLAEIHFSPFSFTDSRQGTPELQTTSKHTAVEDDLFEDDFQLEYSSTEVLDVREDPNAKSRLERPRPDPSQKAYRGVDRSDSGFVSSPTSVTSHKPLAKADSGYSSNVSLRSFQSTKPQPSDMEPPTRQAPPKPTLERSESRASFLGDIELPSPTFKFEDIPFEPEREAPPPPPPPKDFPPVSPTRVTHVSAAPLAHVALLAAPPGGKKGRKTLAPLRNSKAAVLDSVPKSPELTQLSPTGSDSSNSALSIGSGSHKPGKLSRLLSGAGMKGPPTVHVTHPAVDAVPSVPHEVEEKLHEHIGLFPMTTKRLALRTEASMETLKTIFSVGSVDGPHSEDPHSSNEQLQEPKNSHKRDRRLSFQNVPASIVHAAASVIPRKPGGRKTVPAPARKELDTNDSPVRDTESDEIQNGFEANVTSLDFIENSVGNSAFDQAFAAMAEERDAYFSPNGRTMTMTAQLERDLYTRMLASKGLGPNGTPQLDVSPPSQSPINLDVIPAPLRSSKTPPPVSMRTRSMRNLRVPPPLRPQSTPTGANRHSLSRQSSRENVYSYPQANTPLTEDDVSPPPIPPMNPRRSLSVRDYDRSRSLTYQDYDNWLPNSGYSDHGRRGSISSNNGAGITRPVSASPYSHQNLMMNMNVSKSQQLRHRSSYDDYNRQLKQKSLSRGDGSSRQYHRVSMQSADFGPSVSLGSYSQQQFWGGGWDQQGRYPPYVPRSGHHRNKSLGSNKYGHQTNPPYRILHSYNSPAYRNAPIWG